MQRVVVLGGAGNFGARIVRDLGSEPGIEVLVAGRRAASLPVAPPVRGVVLDIDRPDFAEQLRALAPTLVIHCVGPFQGQDYRVVRGALAAGANYLDLADGRDFVAGFAAANDALAGQVGRRAISGASTLPALSSAVIESLVAVGDSLEGVEIAIAPGQRAPRGVATLQAVFSYLGRPVQVLEQGRWHERTGWMDLRRVPLAFGKRLGALCDVPDLALLPRRYPSLRTVRFHAALEFASQHLVLWLLAALRRCGLPLPMNRLASLLHRLAGAFDRLGGPLGGMRLQVAVQRGDGTRLLRTWQLTTPAMHGPEIPCMAATLLARRILRGEPFAPGATTAEGLLDLAQFGPEFARWGISTRIQEQSA